MLLTTGIIIGITTALIELRLVWNTPWLKKLIRSNPILGLFLSMIIAVILGWLFGAAGITALLGGGVASGITWLYYSTDRGVSILNEKKKRRDQRKGKVPSDDEEEPRVPTLQKIILRDIRTDVVVGEFYADHNIAPHASVTIQGEEFLVTDVKQSDADIQATVVRSKAMS